VDADFDDETGGIQLLVGLHVGANYGTTEIVYVGYHVVISAAL
jgi:hypothetical protein